MDSLEKTCGLASTMVEKVPNTLACNELPGHIQTCTSKSIGIRIVKESSVEPLSIARKHHRRRWCGDVVLVPQSINQS